MADSSPRLYRELVYRPRHSAFPYAREESGRACDVAEAKAGNGELLCHGVEEEDVLGTRHTGANQRLHSEWCIALVNNEYDIRVRGYC